MIGNWFVHQHFNHPGKTVFQCVVYVLIVTGYFLFENQTLIGLLKVIGKPI